MTIQSKELRFKAKLEALEEQTVLTFPRIVELLRSGKRLIFVPESAVAEELTSRQLRTLGALVKICGFYGATVIFSPQGTFSMYRRGAAGGPDQEQQN